MKTKYQAAISAIKANKDAIVRKTTVALGVGAGMLIAGFVVDKVRNNSDELSSSDANSFNGTTENPFNIL